MVTNPNSIVIGQDYFLEINIISLPLNKGFIYCPIDYSLYRGNTYQNQFSFKKLVPKIWCFYPFPRVSSSFTYKANVVTHTLIHPLPCLMILQIKTFIKIGVLTLIYIIKKHISTTYLFQISG